MVSCKPQSLTFIAGDSKSRAAREAIRVHVTRRQHSQRKRRRTMLAALDSFQVWDRADVGSEPGATHPSIVKPAKAYALGLSMSSPPTGLVPNSEEVAIPNEATPQTQLPATPISNETTSPSTDVPSAKSLESMLVQHYHQWAGGSSMTHELYRAYCETAATHSAFLAMVSTNYSAEKGQPPPIDPIELENHALREVADQLSRSPSAPATHTMLTVAMLANLREVRNERDLVACHWEALARMVDINGGVERLRVHQSLYSLLFWLEAVALTGVQVSISQYSDSTKQKSESKQELVAFFDDVIASQLTASRHPGKSGHSKLHLAIATTLSTPAHKSDGYSTNKWRSARLACLIHVAALLLNGDRAIEGARAACQEVGEEVIKRQRQYTVYPEELFFILLCVCNQDDRCHISWRVARICCAAKRLPQATQHTCFRLLCSFLGYDDPFAFDSIVEEWDLSSRLLAENG